MRIEFFDGYKLVVLWTVRALGINLKSGPGYWEQIDRSFDRRFGVETTTPIDIQDLGFSGEAAEHAKRYEPTGPVEFTLMIQQLGLRHDEYTFVDLGSGTGRALLLASELGFRRIIRVEYSQLLHDVALENIRRYASKTSTPIELFELVCGDAAEFLVPHDPLVIYMFNRFTGEILQEVERRIEACVKKHQKHVVVVYYNILSQDLFRNTTTMTLNHLSDGTWEIYEAQYRTTNSQRS